MSDMPTHSAITQFPIANDQLLIGGKSVSEHLQEGLSTPCYLYDAAVIKNTISHLRKHQRVQKEGEEKQLDFFAGKLDSSHNEDNPVANLEKSEKINRVVHFISLLPTDARDLLTMKFEQKLSYREISEKTGLTEGNVGYKLHHLLRSLADELKSEGITS